MEKDLRKRDELLAWKYNSSEREKHEYIHIYKKNLPVVNSSMEKYIYQVI